MNSTMMKGKWRQTRGAVRKQWGKLTHDDVTMFLGEGDQLVGRLQERYGYTKQQAQREVSDFLDSLYEDMPMAEEREKAMETVRERPWFTGILFGGVLLVTVGYILNRFFHIVEIEEVHTETR